MLKNHFFNMTVACLSISLGLAACQGSRAKKETLSYQFSNGSCTTGKKTFSDLASYCSVLQDDVANNNCAAELRLETFNKKCSASAKKSDLNTGKSEEVQTALDNSKSYDFSSDNCTTGKKTFPDLATYCAGLKDDDANNHCAAQMRIEAFRKDCLIDYKSIPEADTSEGGQQAPKVNASLLETQEAAAADAPLTGEAANAK